MNTRIFTLLAWLAATAGAQDVCFAYTSSAITECAITSSPVTSSPVTTSSDLPDPTKTVTVTMPECRSAGCDACTYTRTYTKTGTIFHPTGTACQTWTVKEIYPAVSTSPAIVQKPTDASDGFSTTVATCIATCGAPKVTATLEYPTGGKTFTSGTDTSSKPTSARSGAPVAVVSGAAARASNGLTFVIAAAILGCL